MRVVVTDHARQRLKGRLNISDGKIQKFVEKVWKKGEDPGSSFTRQHEAYGHKKRIYKILMGYRFVFVHRDKDIFLITFFPKRNTYEKRTKALGRDETEDIPRDEKV